MRTFSFSTTVFTPQVLRSLPRARNVVEVPVDSEDARKWPAWKPHEEPRASEHKEEQQHLLDTAMGDGKEGTESRVGDDDTVTIPPAKRPGARKPRTSLPALPTKAKKITTLEKSAMDWRAYVTSQRGELQDELVANQRGGGYLDKVDFLQRVEDRRQDLLDTSKASKRRKV